MMEKPQLSEIRFDLKLPSVSATRAGAGRGNFERVAYFTILRPSRS